MQAFEDLLNKVKRYSPDVDVSLMLRAYDFAKKSHLEHQRLSGEPYLIHPLAVANILADIEQDPKVIIAGFLHDVIEDAGVTRQDLEKMFDKEIAKLVEGVTKLSQFSFVSREIQQAENFRKMFIAMGEDFRIIIIKLADRLHNMQTLRFLPPAKQKETALETREIFAPLAHRLGMWKLKWELEDLSFTYLEPAKYAEIKNKVAESRGNREGYIANFIQMVSDALNKVNLDFQINGRPKHFYSIYRKMVDQNLEFDEIYDLTAVRIIVESVKDCYTVLGMLHATWKPIPGRFRDYIAMPKSNGYQSLHTTLIGMDGRPIEVQIRTQEMHRISEYGIAAHWRYKEGKTDEKFDEKMAWLREMMEWQKEVADAKDFMDNLKTNLFMEEVFVFTPKGDVYGFAQDSTPVDFAYRVHTEIGHRTIGAKVNGRIVGLEYKMRHGDIIEILTGKKDNPSKDWLRFARTAGAKVKIRNWFKKQKPGTITTDEIIPEETRSLAGTVSKTPRARKRLKTKASIKVAGLDNLLVRLSKCCSPLPGDRIIGYISSGRGVAIHCVDCPNIKKHKKPKDKLVAVEWIKDSENLFPVEIKVEAHDRVGVLKDILAQISETKTNVSAAKMTTKQGSTAVLKITIDVKDHEHLEQVIKAIKAIGDVYNIFR